MPRSAKPWRFLALAWALPLMRPIGPSLGSAACEDLFFPIAMLGLNSTKYEVLVASHTHTPLLRPVSSWLLSS